MIDVHADYGTVVIAIPQQRPSGLGLFIVDKIIEAHCGTIDVHSCLNFSDSEHSIGTPDPSLRSG